MSYGFAQINHRNDCHVEVNPKQASSVCCCCGVLRFQNSDLKLWFFVALRTIVTKHPDSCRQRNVHKSKHPRNGHIIILYYTTTLLYAVCYYCIIRTFINRFQYESLSYEQTIQILHKLEIQQVLQINFPSKLSWMRKDLLLNSDITLILLQWNKTTYFKLCSGVVSTKYRMHYPILCI